jgi:hypothetical protein
LASILTPDALRQMYESCALTPDQKSQFFRFAAGAGMIDRRVFWAIRQLNLNVDRTTIDKALMELYDVSYRTANRITEQALQYRDCDTDLSQVAGTLEPSPQKE